MAWRCARVAGSPGLARCPALVLDSRLLLSHSSRPHRAGFFFFFFDQDGRLANPVARTLIPTIPQPGHSPQAHEQQVSAACHLAIGKAPECSRPRRGYFPMAKGASRVVVGPNSPTESDSETPWSAQAASASTRGAIGGRGWRMARMAASQTQSRCFGVLQADLNAWGKTQPCCAVRAEGRGFAAATRPGLRCSLRAQPQPQLPCHQPAAEADASAPEHEKGGVTGWRGTFFLRRGWVE